VCLPLSRQKWLSTSWTIERLEAAMHKQVLVQHFSARQCLMADVALKADALVHQFLVMTQCFFVAVIFAA
jgi:pterin-4a-carbinolamine dehydratase